MASGPLLTLLARTRQVALFIHMRGKHDVGLEDFHEVFTNAAVTGTPEPRHNQRC